MKYIVIFFGVCTGVILLIALGFTLNLVDLGFFKFFAPRRENVRRQVFEETQSYVHGKTQDLAKYYEEYQKTEDKETIKSLIKMQFADFEAENIRSYQLKQFLISIRGY